MEDQTQQQQPVEVDFDKLFGTFAGDDLPDDAPGDDRSDSAVMERERSYRQAVDLDWLVGSEEPQQDQGEEERGPLGLAGAAAADMAMGAVEGPRQVLGGMRDMAQSVLDLSDWAGDLAEKQFPIGGLQIFDKDGNFDLSVLSSKELKKAREKGLTGLELPDIKDPETNTGAAVRGISQFLSGFGVAGKVLGTAGKATKAGQIGRAMGQGAAADFFAFGPQEQRLSNLIESVPSLKNPVTEYLAADEDDGELEGRLKNAIEGLGLGVLSDGLFRGLRMMRQMRRMSRDKNAAKNIADAVRFADEEKMLRGATDLEELGSVSPDVPLVLKKTQAAVGETVTGVPDDVAARSLTPRGLTPLEGASDVYINFARIDTPEDIQRIIKDTSSAFSTEIDAARRGVRTNAQTALAADKIDAWETLMARRSGQPLNAEQSVAARQLWATSADKLGQVAAVATDNPTPENLFQFRKMLATHHAIQKEVIAARSETARALQSWAIPTGGSAERMRDMTNALDRMGGPEASVDLARRIAVLSQMDGGAAALSKFVEQSVAAKTLGSIQEYWINSLLSGPKTHMVNMLSNTGVAALDIVERGVGARLGRVFLDETGVEIGEATAQIASLRGSVLDAMRYAGKALMTGQTGFGMDKIEMPRQRYISSGTWNVRSDSWLGRGIDAFGTVVNVPGRLLQAEDEFFKTIGYRKELHAQAYRTAMGEVRAGTLARDAIGERVAQILDNPPEAIRMEAVSHAAYQTFTSEPGKFVKSIQRIIHDYPALKFFIPFINTPANILGYTFERTPLAPLAPKYRAAMAKGGAEADLALTKMALGTTTLLFAVDLGLNGHTTGSGPSDYAERDNWRRQGYQPYSARFGDKYIAFNRLDPLGYHLGIGADIAEFVHNSDPSEETAAEIQEGVAASVFAVAENITSKSYMQGLSLLMEAINDPDRFGPAYLDRFASSFIPSGVGEVARFIDPTMRASHDIVSAMKRKSPVFSKTLPARRDLWGREIKYQSGFGSAYDALSPLYGSTYDPEPIDQFMQQDGWFVGMGGYGFTIGGAYVSLKNRPDIKSRFYQLRGGTKPSEMDTERADGLIDQYGDNTLLETLNGIVTGEHHLSDRFRLKDTPDDREKFIKDIVYDYYKVAKDVLFDEFPELEETAERKKALRQ